MLKFLVFSLALLFLTEAKRLSIPLEFVKDLYTVPHTTDHKTNRHHSRTFHHSDGPDFVKLHYTGTHREGFWFATIHPEHIATVFCRNHTQDVMFEMNSVALAEELMHNATKHRWGRGVVTALPPAVCADSSPISLHIQHVERVTETRVKFLGRPVDMMDVFETLKVDFQTTFMPGAVSAQLRKASEEQQRRHMKAQEARDSDLTEFTQDTLQYIDREMAQLSNDHNAELTREQRERLSRLRNGDKMATYAPGASNSTTTKSKRNNKFRRRLLQSDPDISGSGEVETAGVEGVTGSGEVRPGEVAGLPPSREEENGSYSSLFPPRFMFKHDITALWSWTKGGAFANPTTKRNEVFTTNVQFRPVLHFKIDFHGGDLHIFELWLALYYSYSLRGDFSYGQATNKVKVSNVPLGSLDLPGLVIPIAFLVVSICPKFKVGFDGEITTPSAVRFQPRSGSVSMLRIGAEYTKAQGGNRIGELIPYLPVPRYYEPVLGLACPEGQEVEITRGMVAKAGGCAILCSGDAACKLFSYDIPGSLCIRYSKCNTPMSDWDAQTDQVFWFSKLSSDPFPLLISAPVKGVTFLYGLTFTFEIRLGLGTCSLGIGLGGVDLILRYGNKITTDTEAKDADGLTPLNAIDTFIISLDIALVIDISIRIIVEFRIFSTKLLSQTVFSTPKPFRDYRIRFTSNNGAPCGSDVYTWYQKPGMRLGLDAKVAENILNGKRGDMCTGIDTRSNTIAAVHRMLPQQLTMANGFVPREGDAWVGTCDAEVFEYRVRVNFVSFQKYLMTFTIYDRSADKLCTVRGLYRGRMLSSTILSFLRRADPDFEGSDCWMQAIPPRARLLVRSEYGSPTFSLSLYHNSSTCPFVNLRYGTSYDTLPDGYVLGAYDAMASDAGQLIVQDDGNVFIASYSTDSIVWSAGTSAKRVLNGNPLRVALALENGTLTLRHSYDNFKTLSLTKVITPPTSPKQPVFMRLDDCDITMFSSFTSKNTWRQSQRQCISNGTSQHPLYPHGGNELRQGEIMRQNNALFNNLGMVMYDSSGSLIFVQWQTLDRIWTISPDMGADSRPFGLSLTWTGELVLVDYSGKVLWSAGTGGSGASVLRLEQCSLVLYKMSPQPTVVWSSRSFEQTSCRPVPDTTAFPLRTPSGFHNFNQRLERGQYLIPGQSLLSASAQLIHLPDGNVVLYNRPNNTIPTAVWSTQTSSTRTAAFSYDVDGMVGLYKTYDGTAASLTRAWTTPIAPASGGEMLILGNDCSLSVYASTTTGNMIPGTLVKAINTATCSNGGSSDDVVFSDYTDTWWLEVGYPLNRGQSIYSQDGSTCLLHQPDGDVVFFVVKTQQVLWRTNTAGKCTSGFAIETNRVVLYDCSGTGTLWTLPTSQSVYYLVLSQETTSFELQSLDETSVWSSSSLFPAATLPPTTISFPQSPAGFTSPSPNTPTNPNTPPMNPNVPPPVPPMSPNPNPTPSSDPSTSSSSSTSSYSSSAGAVVAAVIPSVVGTMVVMSILFLLYLRRLKKQNATSSTANMGKEKYRGDEQMGIIQSHKDESNQVTKEIVTDTKKKGNPIPDTF